MRATCPVHHYATDIITRTLLAVLEERKNVTVVGYRTVETRVIQISTTLNLSDVLKLSDRRHVGHASYRICKYVSDLCRNFEEGTVCGELLGS